MLDDVVSLAEGIKGDGADVTIDFPPEAVPDFCLLDRHACNVDTNRASAKRSSARSGTVGYHCVSQKLHKI